MYRLLAFIAVPLLLSAAARADFTNGGFEGGPTAGNFANLNPGSTAITGWTVLGNDGTTNADGRNIDWLGSGAFGLYTPFGTNFLDLTGTTDGSPFNGIGQSVTTVPGDTYTVSFSLGAQGTSGVYGGPVSATVTIAGSSSVVSASGAAVSGTTSVDGTVWTPEAVTFTATSGSTAVDFLGDTTAGGEFIGLDNVSLSAGTAPTMTSAIPEPMSLALLGIAVVGLEVVRKRRGGVRQIPGGAFDATGR